MLDKKIRESFKELAKTKKPAGFEPELFEGQECSISFAEWGKGKHSDIIAKFYLEGKIEAIENEPGDNRFHIKGDNFKIELSKGSVGRYSISPLTVEPLAAEEEGRGLWKMYGYVPPEGVFQIYVIERISLPELEKILD